MRPRHTTTLAQARDALGTLLCMYRRYGLSHVGMVLDRGRCVQGSGQIRAKIYAKALLILLGPAGAFKLISRMT